MRRGEGSRRERRGDAAVKRRRSDMDRMKTLLCALACALVASFALGASAQDEETSEQVDWAEAAEYAELMDTWVNAKDVEMATYYDEAQNVLWSQPAAMSVEDATAELAEDPEGAMLDSISQWIVPKVLWLCGKDESDDSGCDDGDVTNYKWAAGDFSLSEVDDNWAYYNAESMGCSNYTDVERIYTRGTSYVTDYCDGNFYAKYYVGSSAYSPDEDDCYRSLLDYYYYLDDSSHINNRTYSGYGEKVMRYRFLADQYYYVVVSIASCLE
jgi:hypothetical protein